VGLLYKVPSQSKTQQINKQFIQIYRINKNIHSNTAAILPTSICCNSSPKYVDQNEKCSLKYDKKMCRVFTMQSIDVWRPHQHDTRHMTSPKDVQRDKQTKVSMSNVPNTRSKTNVLQTNVRLKDEYTDVPKTNVRPKDKYPSERRQAVTQTTRSYKQTPE